MENENLDTRIKFPFKEIDFTASLESFYCTLLSIICNKVLGTRAHLCFTDEMGRLEVFSYTMSSVLGEWVDVRKKEVVDSHTLLSLFDTCSFPPCNEIFSGPEYVQCEFSCSFAKHAKVVIEGCQKLQENKVSSVGDFCSFVISQKEKIFSLIASQCKERGSKILSTLVHDIRNPLSGVTGFAQLLKRKLTDAKQIEYCDVIQNTLLRIETCAAEPVRFVRGDASCIEIVPINIDEQLTTIMGGVVESFPTQEINFSTHFSSNSTIGASVDWIKKIILALVDNAVSALPQKGCIRIECKNNDSNIEISITDNGRGVPLMVLPHISKPLFAYQKPKNAGMGLAMVAYMVHEFNGSIRFFSIPCTGTTCLLSFPGLE